MIRENIGWTVMPEYLCAQSIAGGQIVEVNVHERLPVNSIYLVWIDSSLRNPLVSGIRDRILELSKIADLWFEIHKIGSLIGCRVIILSVAIAWHSHLQCHSILGISPLDDQAYELRGVRASLIRAGVQIRPGES